MAKKRTSKHQSRAIGYIRVSTDKQDTKNQELALRRHADKIGIRIDDFTRAIVSSRKTTKQRRIDELLQKLNKGDTLVVAELSRLARSVGQVATIVDALVSTNIRFISIKEGLDLNGKPSMQNKVTITMFSLFAELERDLISERTKEGLARARANGTKLGRPKGSTGKSKLDGKEAEIQRLLSLKVTKANIAKIAGCSWGTLDGFIKSRKLKPVKSMKRIRSNV